MRVHGRASTYTFTNGVINTQPNIGSSAFTVNNAKFLPQPRLGLAWSPISGPRKTVVRAGFGMYNDLQDALGYRTDQNAPFNPTYSLANESVAKLPLSTSAPVPAAAKLVPGGVQPDLQTPDAHLLVSADPAGDHFQHFSDGRLRRLPRISRAARHRRERAFSGNLSGLAVPRHLSLQFPHWPGGDAGTRWIVLQSDRNQAERSSQQYLDIFFGSRQLLQRPANRPDPPL